MHHKIDNYHQIQKKLKIYLDDNINTKMSSSKGKEKVEASSTPEEKKPDSIAKAETEISLRPQTSQGTKFQFLLLIPKEA